MNNFFNLINQTNTKFLVFVVVTFLISGCGGSAGRGSTPSVAAPVSCGIAEQRQWLDEYMKDQYYWFDKMGLADLQTSDMSKYFKSLLYSELDHFSYTEPTEQYNQFYGDGSFVGYGYSLAWNDSTKAALRVRHVESKSPVGIAGMQRGDTIISIDGNTPEQIVSGNPGRVNANGIPRTFVIRDGNNSTRTFTTYSDTFSYISVPTSSVIDVQINGRTSKVGYLVYQQFIQTSESELASVFYNFFSTGISELILDLRYNGGGSLKVTRDLASTLVGIEHANKKFAELRYNIKHPESNSTYYFASQYEQLPAIRINKLKKLIVITSEDTASASELLINGLKPYLDVILIGNTTFGKPYGFSAVEACGTTYNAVNFEIVNALGMGGYSNGLTPTCVAPDDLDHQLGDPLEARLATALQYLKSGACPATLVRPNALWGIRTSDRFITDNGFGEIPRQRLRAD